MKTSLVGDLLVLKPLISRESNFKGSRLQPRVARGAERSDVQQTIQCLYRLRWE